MANRFAEGDGHVPPFPIKGGAVLVVGERDIGDVLAGPFRDECRMLHLGDQFGARQRVGLSFMPRVEQTTERCKHEVATRDVADPSVAYVVRDSPRLRILGVLVEIRFRVHHLTGLRIENPFVRVVYGFAKYLALSGYKVGIRPRPSHTSMRSR